MSMHVVVTGAGGFVGGFVTKYLATHGFRVTATTRKFVHSGQEGCDGATWIETDLTNPGGLPAQFDALVHCAALLPSTSCDSNRLYSENLTMASNAFIQAMNANAKTVVLLSSMSVYGSIHVAEVTEETKFHDPGAYGKAKYDAECELEKCIAASLWSGLSIRLPGTVGRGSHHNFISDTLKSIRASKKIEIKNPEALFNNIVFVEDLAKFLMRWILAPRKGYFITNLASCAPMRIRDVISLLYMKANKPEMVRFDNASPTPFLISLNRAIDLGFIPSTVQESIASFTQAELMW